MSLMDDADDDGFAALLDGLNEDEAADSQMPQLSQGGLAASMLNDEEDAAGAHEDGDHDWDAVLAAAEAEEADDEQQQQQPDDDFQLSQSRSSQPQWTPNATAAAGSAAPLQSRSFSDMFTTTPLSSGFAASVAAALGPASSQAATAAASSSFASSANVAARIPKREMSSSSAFPPSSQVGTAPSSAVRRIGVASSSSSGSAAAAPKRTVVEFGVLPAKAPEVSPFVKEANEELRDKISGFRVTNRLISSVTLKDKLQGSQVFSLTSLIRRSAAAPSRPAVTSLMAAPSPGAGGSMPAPGGAFGLVGNWVLFGVLTHRGLPRESSSGKGGKFCVWTVGDLEGHAATVMLFGKAFDAYGMKIPEGAVVALANADDSSSFVGGGGNKSSSNARFGDKSSSSGTSLCLSLKHVGQVLHLGLATDFGYCKSFKNERGTFGGTAKSMVKCKNVVNLSKSEYCEYHVKSEYLAIKNKRPDVNQTRDRSSLPFSASGPAAPMHRVSAAKSASVGAHVLPHGAQQAGRLGTSSTLLSATIHAATEASKRLLAGKGGAKAALKQREEKRSEAERAAEAARWEALSSKSKASSRFVARVVSTQLPGARGAPVLAAKDLGHMMGVDKLSAEVKAEAAGAGLSAALVLEKKLQAAKNGHPAAPAAAAATVRPHTAAVASGTTAGAAATRPSSAASTPSSAAASARPPSAAPSSAAAAASATTAVPAARNTLADAFRNVVSQPAKPSPSVPARSFTAAATTVSAPPSASQTARPASASGPQKPVTAAAAAPATARPATASSAAAAAPAWSVVSSSAFLKSFSSTVPDTVPMLGRGWEHPATAAPSKPPAPRVLNGDEKRRAMAQALQAEQIAALRAQGGLAKPDPNSTATRAPLRPLINGVLSTAASSLAGNKRKAAEPAPAAPNNIVLNADGRVTMARPLRSAEPGCLDSVDDGTGAFARASTEDASVVAKRARLSAAFGFSELSGAADSAVTARMLDASHGSAHKDLIVPSASAQAAEEALFDLMAKKESMAVQLGSITSQKVKAYRCMHAGCPHAAAPAPSEYPPAGCKAKGHRIDRVESVKRFFNCQGCKFFLVTLAAKLPSHACHKCGGTIWLKSAMMPLKVDSSDRNQLQLRSEETQLRSTYA